MPILTGGDPYIMNKDSVKKILRIVKIVLFSCSLVLLAINIFTDLPVSHVLQYLIAAFLLWAIADAIVTAESKKQAYSRMAMIVVTLIVCLAVAWGAGYFLIRNVFAGGQTSQVDSQETAKTSFSSIPGQFPSDTKTINPDFPAGTCVNLHGTRTNTQIDKAGCGSPENNFIVVQQVQKPTECVGDVDQKYYTNTAGRGEWTVCMDYYWVQGSCLSMNGFDIKRVKCDDSTKPAREKPVRLAQNSTSISDCPAGGFDHPVRRFTVCTETQGSP